MPHSSGGGSSGGGSHGGSKGSGKSGPRSSKTYFPGSHRYVYYHNAMPFYYYTDTPPGNKKGNLALRLALSVLLLLAILAFFGFSLYTKPKKLRVNYDARVYVQDELGIFTDQQRQDLTQTLSEFLELTGIAPVVVTQPNASWQSHYSTLEGYAYDLYVKSFSDEKHWLILYTQPEKTPPGEKGEWYWEGMQGDDTDTILTSKKADAFTKCLHGKLTQEPLPRALQESFQESMKTIMDPEFDSEAFLYLIVCLVVGVLVIINLVRTTLDQNKKVGALRLETDQGEVREETCAYCGGRYVSGMHQECPHCGAPLKQD